MEQEKITGCQAPNSKENHNQSIIKVVHMTWVLYYKSLEATWYVINRPKSKSNMVFGTSWMSVHISIHFTNLSLVTSLTITLNISCSEVSPNQMLWYLWFEIFLSYKDLKYIVHKLCGLFSCAFIEFFFLEFALSVWTVVIWGGSMWRKLSFR